MCSRPDLPIVFCVCIPSQCTVRTYSVYFVYAFQVSVQYVHTLCVQTFGECWVTACGIIILRPGSQNNSRLRAVT